VDGTHGMPKHVEEGFVHLLCLYLGNSPFEARFFISMPTVQHSIIYIQKYRFSAHKDKNGGDWGLT